MSEETNNHYREIAEKLLLLRVKKTFLTTLKHYLLTTPSDVLFVFKEYLDTIKSFKGNNESDLNFIDRGLIFNLDCYTSRYGNDQNHNLMFNEICSHVRNYNNLTLLKEILKFIEVNPDIRHIKDIGFDPYYVPNYFSW